MDYTNVAISGLTPPRQARSRETMDRLLRAARELLEERGVRGLSLRDVAIRAGVSTGTLYTRFRTKEALLETLHLQLCVDLESFAEESFRHFSAQRGDLTELTREVILRYVAKRRAVEHATRAFLELGSQNRGIRARHQELAHRHFCRSRDLVIEALGLEPSPELTDTVAAVLRTLIFATRHHVETQFVMPASQRVSDQKFASDLASLLVSGLGRFRRDVV